MSNSSFWTDPFRRRSLVLLGLLVGTVYLGTLRSGFHYDDFHSIVRNPHLTLNNLGAFFVDPTTFSVNPASAMFRPLLLTTFALNRSVFGDAPWSWHLVNVAIHALAAVAGLWLLGLLGWPGRAGLLAALLFAVHPVNSEAVAYVSSRSELLAALLMIVACCFSLRCWYGRRPRQAAAAVASLAGGLLTKSVAVVTPALALLSVRVVDRSWHRAQDRAWRGMLVASVAVTAAYLVLLRGATSRVLFEAPVRDLAVQAATQVKALVYYLWLMVVPVHLSVEHQFRASRGVDVVVAAAFVCLASLLVAILRTGRRWRWGAGWWLICLAPTLIVPLIVLVNEHRLYGASLGAFAVLALLIDTDRGGRRPVAVGLVAAYTIILCLLSLQRVSAWQSESTLWEDAAAKAPASLKAQLRWADALSAAGDLARAESAYLRAVALRPYHPAARNNLGRLYLLQRRWEDARRQFEILLTASPDNTPARMNLAQTQVRQGRFTQARENYLLALRYDRTGGRAQLRLAQIGLQDGSPPGDVLAWVDRALAAGERSVDVQIARGIALRRLGRLDEAINAYQHALAADSTSIEAWYNLGNARVENADTSAARTAYRHVIEYAPENDPLQQAARQRLRALVP